jgi:flagellar basal body-associated protein FliL
MHQGAEIMKRTLITIILTAVVVLTLVGLVSSQFMLGSPLASRSQEFGFGGGGGGVDLYAASPPIAEQPAAPEDISKSANQAGEMQTAVNRLVIKNAELAIVVSDPKADMARITKLADEMGGYVVSSNLFQSYYGPNSIEVPEATITIRVPSEKLDEALARIKEDAVDIDSENVSGQDVTSEYVDLQSRLTAKQAAEKKLLEILDEAKETEDVLAVYTELQMIQTEIESLKGQIKYYEQSAALSSISVRLIAEAGTQPIAIGPWRPEGAAKDAVEDLVFFFQNFVEFLIRFVIFVLPSLILIAIPLFLVFLGGRALFRRFRKSNPVVEEKVEEKK